MAEHAKPVQRDAGAADARAAARPVPARDALKVRPEAEALDARERILNERPGLKAQRAAAEALVQRAAGGPKPIQRAAADPQPRQDGGSKALNRTGLPDRLKAGVESLSGLSMDDVKVHYGSSALAALGASAYAQGSDIHVGPGQERHLAHEAWHVVQQKQGRVRATMQMKEGTAINDDSGLEHEADVMGAKALRGTGAGSEGPLSAGGGDAAAIVQRRMEDPIAPEPLVGGRGEPVSDKALGVEPSEVPAEGKGDKEKRIAMLAEVALARIEKAVAEADGTIALTEDLERIKTELGLQAIKLVDVGKPTVRVMFEINPWIKYDVPSSTEVRWEMVGTQTKALTNVKWSSDTISVGGASANVGKAMIADPLAPDHEPGSLSTQDSAQNAMMQKLANAGTTSKPNDQKYIKGHLLNDHVGGPGQSFNLFPITADANAKHLAYVEKYVKAQLGSRYVVYYKIEVDHGAPKAGSSGYSVDSNFNFTWSLLNIHGAPLGGTHTSQIQSNYNATGAAPFDVTDEYEGEYDKLNRGKSTPKTIGQTGQWQVGFSSPSMGPMGKVTTSKSPISIPLGSSGTTAPTALDFTGVSKKQDSSGAEYISVRNSDAPDDSAVGGKMDIGASSSPETVTIKSISPLSGGWTRIYF
jgi:hypothetical protein